MIEPHWIALSLVAGFVGLAATACIVEWRRLAAETRPGAGSSRM
ncbi:hypothetical protein [Rhodoplanes azumiensis]|uniref:Uncharacterized protein n=1 Tax=Rhodoplanes azumiensis TaxID=1897628 RepID=A0ABW5AKZ3_9BRAD